MREDRKTNYYALLELTPTATASDIKKAWHEQLQVWHPDRFTHAPSLHRKAEARTQLINRAYETLSDPAARARYDAAAHPAASTTPHATTTPPARPTPPPKPQPAPRARSESRGPRSLITLSRQGQPKLMVPAIHILVDSQEHLPYEFQGFTRIAGTTRQALPAGDYVIAEAPELFCVERKRVEEVYSAFSNPLDNRQPFLQALERLVPYPHRFLVIEGTLPHQKAAGRLEQYHKNSLMDFLDALTAKFGVQIVYTEGRDPAEERVANLAAMHYAYFFAEQQGLSACLNEDDL